MAYCTVEDLKQFGYTISDDDLVNLASICDIASAKVDAYCHQSFSETDGAKEEHLIRIKDGIAKIFPRNLVIREVNSVTFFTVRNTPITYTVRNLTYLKGGAVIVGSTDAPDGEYYVVLDYNYGFANDDYPDDLIQATALMAVPSLDDYFLAGDTNMSGVKMLQQGKLKIERGTLSANAKLNSAGVPINAATLLDGGGYVRVRGAWL